MTITKRKDIIIMLKEDIIILLPNFGPALPHPTKILLLKQNHIFNYTFRNNNYVIHHNIYIFLYKPNQTKHTWNISFRARSEVGKIYADHAPILKEYILKE